MARDFSGSTSNDLEKLTAPPVTAVALSVSAWVDPDTISGIDTVFALSADSGSYAAFELALNAGTPNARAVSGGTVSAAAATASLSAGAGFQHCGAVFASATDRRAFAAGGNKGTNATSRTPTSILYTSIGVGYSGSTTLRQNAFDGRIAEVGLWNVALSDDDMYVLGQGLSPLFVRRDGLIAYWRVLGRNSPEDDVVGANQLTVRGSCPQADHCRVILPRGRKLIGRFSAPSGASYDDSISFAATPATSSDGLIAAVGAVALPAVPAQSGSTIATVGNAASLAAVAGLSDAGALVFDLAASLPATAGAAMLGGLGLFDVVSFAATGAQSANGAVVLDATIALPGIPGFGGVVQLDAVGAIIVTALDAFAASPAGSSFTVALVLPESAGLAIGHALDATAGARLDALAGTAAAGSLVGTNGVSLAALAGLDDSGGMDVAGAVSLATQATLAELAGLDAGGTVSLALVGDTGAHAALMGAASASLGSVVLVAPDAAVIAFVPPEPGTLTALDALAGALDVTLAEATALGVGDTRIGDVAASDAGNSTTADDAPITEITISDG